MGIETLALAVLKHSDVKYHQTKNNQKTTLFLNSFDSRNLNFDGVINNYPSKYLEIYSITFAYKFSV